MNKKETAATVSDMIRLRDEYHAMAHRCREAAKTQRGDKAAELQGMAKAYGGVWLDMDDMAQGKKHPTLRRLG